MKSLVKSTLYFMVKTASAVLTVLAVFSVTMAQSVSYNGSVQFSTGNYIFTDRTNSFYFFNGFTISGNNFSLSTSIPVIYQNTAYISYLGPIVVPTGGSQHSQVTMGRGKGKGGKITIIDTTSTSVQETGLGDPSLHFDVLAIGNREATSIHILADAKIPVATFDSGFGTGEWDYGFGLSINQKFGNAYAFADATYWVLGDPPGLHLINPVSYGAAIGYMFPQAKVGLMASLSGYTKIIDGVSPPVYLGAGINYLIAKGIGINGNTTFGLTDSTPGVSFSFGWVISL